MDSDSVKLLQKIVQVLAHDISRCPEMKWGTEDIATWCAWEKLKSETLKY
jgi:hypothetical protein